jgi:hypothetical protein
MNVEKKADIANARRSRLYFKAFCRRDAVAT